MTYLFRGRLDNCKDTAPCYYSTAHSILTTMNWVIYLWSFLSESWIRKITFMFTLFKCFPFPLPTQSPDWGLHSFMQYNFPKSSVRQLFCVSVFLAPFLCCCLLSSQWLTDKPTPAFSRSLTSCPLGPSTELIRNHAPHHIQTDLQQVDSIMGIFL